MRRVAHLALLVCIGLELAGTWSRLSRSDPYDDSDSAYYYQRSREIAAGRWTTESVIVSHLVEYPSVEHPSFDHWQPMVAVLSGGAGWLLGDTDLGAKFVLFAFGSVLLPGLMCAFVSAGGGSRTACLVAIWSCLSLARLDHYRLVLDTVVFAGTFLLAGCLVGALAASRTPRPSSFLCAGSGVAFGLAAMTRGDALAVGFLMCVLLGSLAPAHQRLRVFGLVLLAFVAACLPLLAKNVVQFGWPVPPGVARAPFLTHFCDWSSFRRDPLPAALTIGDFWATRVFAFRRAGRALLESWGVLGGLAVIVLCAAVLMRTGVAGLGRLRRLVTLLVVSAASYAFFNLVGILLAPALTLWFHRSPLPYWPTVLAGAVLGADHLVRQARRAVWRHAAIAAGLALLLPSIAFNPLRQLQAAPMRIAGAYEEAASALPRRAVVATNAPLPLYVHHGGGVVRLPGNGEQAIAEAIEHYRAEYLVLFPIERDCDSQQFLYRFLHSRQNAGPAHSDLAGRIPLVRGAGTDSYQVYRIERSLAGGGAPP